MGKLKIIITICILIFAVSASSAQPFIEDTVAHLQGVFGCSVAWGDYDNDGFLDILLTGNNNGSGPVTKVYHNNGDGTFTDQTGIALTNVRNSSVAWADFDNDGNLDILLTGDTLYGNNVISKIYHNNGNGTFTELLNTSLIGITNGSVACGDYDNDGYPDILLTGTSNEGNITKLYHNNGNNTFREQNRTLLPGLTFGSVAWGDYNKDGYLDFIISGSGDSGPISKIYHNNGDGTFTERTDIALSGYSMGTVAWGDYDNDGKLDFIITGSSGSDTVSKIYHNIGDSTFEVQSGILLPILHESSIAWGDYDNDGYLDILLSGVDNRNNFVTKIYRNNGNRTFTEQAGISLDKIYMSSVVWGDYDNDGDLDILMAGTLGSSAISKIYRNEAAVKNSLPSAPVSNPTLVNGSNVTLSWISATDAQTHPKGLSYNARVGTTTGANNVVSSCSRSDGKRKVSAMGNCQNDTMIILKNLKKGTYYWSVQAIDNDFAGGNFSAEQSFTISANKQASGVYEKSATVATIDIQWNRGNGNKCAVFAKKGISGTVTLADNTTYTANASFGSGSCVSSNWYCVYNGTGNEVTMTNLEPFNNYIVQVIDYEGTAGAEKYYTGTGSENPAVFKTAGFNEQKSILLNSVQYGSVAWGDYDNDGRLDILLSGQNLGSFGNIAKIYHNNGDSTFTEQTSLTGVMYSSVAWGDYDNDGFLDILLTGTTTTYQSSGAVSKIYHNNGNKTFTEQTGITLTGVSQGSVAWGDYNNDGNLDILLTGLDKTDHPVSKVYRNNGDSTFSEQLKVSLTPVFLSSVTWGDYDNDGYLDILLTGATKLYPYSPVSKVYRNNGDGTFTEQTGIILPGVYQGSAAWGDYDNDGYLDILLTGALTANYFSDYNQISKVYHNNGNGTFSEQHNISLTGVCQGSAVWGDYNSDGYPDILLSGISKLGNVTKIFKNSGTGIFSEQSNMYLAGVSLSSITWGDYNNDGDLDFLCTGYTGSSIISRVYKNFSKIIDSITYAGAPAGLNGTIDGTNFKLFWKPVKIAMFPGKALTYNVKVGRTLTGEEIATSMSDNNGFRKIATMGNAGYDTFFVLKNILPGKYYWTVQAVDNSFTGGKFATRQIIIVDSIQANKLTATIFDSTSLLVRWKRGNGQRCIVFCKSGSWPYALPSQNTTYVADDTYGNGDKIGSTGWYCVYNGYGDSLLLKGLLPNTDYTIHVIEYTGSHSTEKYFREIRADNVGTFGTGLFTEQTNILLAGANNSTISWGDYDNDGYLDILLTGINSINQGITKIYHNDGNNSFSENTSANLPGVTFGSATWGDYDNDGYLDVLITGTSTTGQIIAKIYHNNDNGTFTEKTKISLTGVFYGSTACSDYDNDGFLDILSTGTNNWGTTNFSELYHNNRDSTFAEITNQSFPPVFLSSVAWGDYDNDGYPDILLTGTKNWGSTSFSIIYHNNGNGTFTEDSGISLRKLSFSSVAWGDYDNDGFSDILMTGYDTSFHPLTLIYHNNGDNTFTEKTGISLTGVAYSSVAWGDYDNDGYLDILLTGATGTITDQIPVTRIYRNNGNGTFNEIIGTSLTNCDMGSACWGDYDNDGDMDILLTGSGYSKIFRNNTFVKLGNFGANQKPKAPENLSNVLLPKTVRLQWSPVTTDETPAKTMSYNVRLRKDMDTIWRSASLASDSGIKHTVSYGNTQLNTFYIIKNLIQGKYYWQVQAVDQGYKGGDWSAVDSFELRSCQAFFKNDTACNGLSTHFTDQSVSSEGINSHLWSFGDGQQSSQVNPVHKYSISGTYKTKLIIASSSSKDSIEHDVTVKASPDAGFTAPNMCEGTTVAFTDTSKSNGFNINSWLWQFGDGQTSILQQPGNHTYAHKGTFHTKLNIIVANGCSDSLLKDVVLADIPSTAISVNGNTTICKGDSVQLMVAGQSSYTYQWQLNNINLTSANKNTFFVKTGSGTYKVKVTNSQAIQCYSISDPVTIEVKEKPPVPLISEASNISIYCPGTLIHLQVDQSSNLYTYQWKRNSVPIDNATQPVLEGKLQGGAYSLQVSLDECNVVSSSLNLTTKPAPAKPRIFAQGPNVWLLACSNDTASEYRWYYNGQLMTGAKTYFYVANKNLGEYNVAINNGGECYTSSDIISIPSGKIINDIEILLTDSIIVFPNPSTGKFTIVAGNHYNNKVTLEIMDLNGRVVYKKLINNIEVIETKKMRKGLYLIKITNDRKVITIKHIVQ